MSIIGFRLVRRSYFMQQLAHIFRAGLLYLICELYIDDLIVHGNKDDEFLKNLHNVFLRIRQDNCDLKPSKCKLGESQIEYVGRVLSHDSTTMKDKNTKKVLDFPEPTRVKQIQRLIGLVNYFRDYVCANHSELVRPLQAYLSQNKANQ